MYGTFKGIFKELDSIQESGLFKRERVYLHNNNYRKWERSYYFLCNNYFRSLLILVVKAARYFR